MEIREQNTNTAVISRTCIEIVADYNRRQELYQGGWREVAFACLARYALKMRMVKTIY